MRDCQIGNSNHLVELHPGLRDECHVSQELGTCGVHVMVHMVKECP